MTDQDKFQGMKARIIAENEAAYGQEAREKYGDEAVDGQNARLAGMSREEWERLQREEADCKAALRRAAEADDPAGADAQEAVRLHAAWLAHYWPAGAVTPQAHAGMAAMYVQDPRFAAYYDAVVPGGAAFLERAVRAYYGSRDQ